jgi:hypothetical protein
VYQVSAQSHFAQSSVFTFESPNITVFLKLQAHSFSFQNFLPVNAFEDFTSLQRCHLD